MQPLWRGCGLPGECVSLWRDGTVSPRGVRGQLRSPLDLLEEDAEGEAPLGLQQRGLGGGGGTKRSGTAGGTRPGRGGRTRVSPRAADAAPGRPLGALGRAAGGAAGPAPAGRPAEPRPSGGRAPAPRAPAPSAVPAAARPARPPAGRAAPGGAAAAAARDGAGSPWPGRDGAPAAPRLRRLGPPRPRPRPGWRRRGAPGPRCGRGEPAPGTRPGALLGAAAPGWSRARGREAPLQAPAPRRPPGPSEPPVLPAGLW